MKRGESEQLVESKRRLERRNRRGEQRYRPRHRRQRHWFRGALYATWYLLLAAAAVSAVYHLLVI